MKTYLAYQTGQSYAELANLKTGDFEPVENCQVVLTGEAKSPKEFFKQVKSAWKDYDIEGVTIVETGKEFYF